MGRIEIFLMLASAAGCRTPSSSALASPPVPHSTEALTTPARQADPPLIIGVWRGTSQCTVRPSPCNDEIVVYHVSAGAGPDDFMFVANKVVGEEEQEMGTLQCQLQRSAHQVDCKIDKGTFRYTINGDRMHGTLDLTDGTRYRVIEIERVR